MKVMFCLECGDIRAMDRAGGWSSCLCGNITARWRNPRQGTVDVKRSSNPKTTRFIGLDNKFLFSDLTIKGGGTNENWRDLHKSVTSLAHGYVFHETVRNCWACIIPVGVTNDIDWFDESNSEKAENTSLSG